MSLPQFTVYRHGRRHRALITLAGELDLESAPLVRTALASCPSDGTARSTSTSPDPAAQAPPHQPVPLACVLAGDVQ
ncbi:hypothetical protein AB0L99_46085 [Streptomyces sp. NPDC051954]|uniref:hypothetical protein n=1 Tax=unclassified Streptomyces TaxID=2593676 RepID=UPI00343AF26E